VDRTQLCSTDSITFTALFLDMSGMPPAVRSDFSRLRQEHESRPDLRGELTPRKVATPAGINPSGDISSGVVRTQMDSTGGLTFTQQAAEHMHTVAVHGMHLLQPVKVDDFLSVDTSVEHVGRTLITFAVEGRPCCFQARVREMVTRASFTFTNVDDAGKAGSVSSPFQSLMQ
jgi:acyl-CoA hydrolase